jgi:hypothetical protein
VSGSRSASAVLAEHLAQGGGERIRLALHAELPPRNYPRDQTPNVDGPTEEFIRRVRQYLEWSRQQIESFNRSLE